MKFLPITFAVFVTADMLGNAQTPSLRPQFTVSTAAVAKIVVTSLASKGIQVSADQVKLPSDVLASEENPAIEVSAVERLGRLNAAQPGMMSASVKLKCQSTTVCRPFFAIATWREDQQAVPAATASASSAQQSVHAAHALAEEHAAPVIKSGQPVTLIMDADHAHIQMAVVSMSNASLGQKVRVATPDHKHFYMAEVLGPGAVKGTF